MSRLQREWVALTDRLTTECAGYDVTMEVLNPNTGDSATVERLPFASITYDPRDDVVAVSVGGNSRRYPVVLRHLIHHPRELVVDGGGHGATLRITDSAATTTLVRLLPATRPDTARDS